MTSVGEGAARGLQAGWQMGMQADQAERQRMLDERQLAQQDRQFGLQEQTAARQQATADAALARQNAQLDRQNAQDDYGLLNDQLKELTQRSAALQSQGQPVPPELGQQYGQVATALRQHRERMLAPRLAAQQADDSRYWSDVSAGKVDPAQTKPAELFQRFSRATGMLPKDVVTAAGGAQMVEQGFDQGNQQVMLQGVNQLVANQLKRGVGTESPHGGVITRKEIVGLVPVKDANGVEHPDKVFPVLRVYVMHPNGAGAEDYYDAPLTQNGTSDPNDPPKALDLNHAFDYMGKVGAMARLLQQPDLAAKLAQGEKEVGDQTQRDVDTINALGRYHLQEAAKGAVAQKIQAIYATLPPGEERDKAVRVAMGVEAPAKAPAAGVQRDEARVERIKQMRADGLIDDAQAGLMLKAITTGVHDSRVIGLEPPPKAAKAGKTATAPATGGKDLSKLTGEAALNAMDPQDAAYVIRLGSGIADVKNIPARGTERVRLIKLTQQVFPDFNEHDYGVTDRAEKAFTTGVLGNKVRSINVAVDHLSTLGEAGKALNNGNMQPLNDIMNYFGVKTGGNAVTDFQAVKQLVADEVVSAIVPGVGALADRKEAGKIFDEVKSPAQLAGAVEKVQKLMGGQINGLYSQYRSGGGKRDFQAFLSSAGKDAMRSVGALPPAGEIPLRKPGQSAYGMQPVAPMGGSGAPAAAPAKALTPQDQQAIGWAKANPNDPRAVKILQMHGM